MKETLHRVKLEQLQAQFSIRIRWAQPPKPFQDYYWEANDANMIGPDEEKKTWTTSLGFALAQIRLVFYSQTLFSVLLRE